MSRWRPALRMARRDLRRHKVRAALTVLLVALPVFVAVVAAQVVANDRWTPERDAQERMYAADASIVVAPFTSVRTRPALDGNAVPVKGAEDRDPTTVDVLGLLPEGSRVVSGPLYSTNFLVTGGTVDVVTGDFADPLLEGFAILESGRWGTAPDEVVVPDAVAQELGLTDGGILRDDATLTLREDVRVDVVGTAEFRRGGDFLYVLAPPASVLVDPDDQWQVLLADLPELDLAATRALVADAAAAGVAVQPRDAVANPGRWNLYEDVRPIEVEPILVGALVVLVGLLEVVLLVGAAFSVAARRQVRDLGLLAANGAAAPDVRRVLLAQGLVLGVLSSFAGAALGVLAFDRLAPGIAERLDRELFSYDISWLAVVVIAVLGSTTAVVAALLPAMRAARLTPVQSLSGRFPVKPGESRAHRPAFVLALGGLLLLVLGGIGTAVAEGRYVNWVGVTLFASGLGLVLLVVGAVWCTPYVVRRLSRLGDRLPLSGRYAFRDAGRHRFRTSAAVMALMITVAGAVLAGFGLSSAATASNRDSLAPRTAEIGIDAGPDATSLRNARETIDRILDPVSVATRSVAVKPGTERQLELVRIRDAVSIVDEASLRELVTLDPTALEVFRAGGVVTTYESVGDEVALGIYARGRKPVESTTLPAAVVSRASGVTPYTSPTYISEETAATLGVARGYTEMTVRNATPVTQDQIERLRVYGLYSFSDDPERALMDRLQYAGLGVAGLLAALVVGIAVALAAAESREEVATLAAVGAGPWRRRGFGAMHGVFLGLVGTGLGIAVGLPAGVSFTQADGLPGVDVPWLVLLGLVVVVLPVSWLVGAVVTPSRFTPNRRLT